MALYAYRLANFINLFKQLTGKYPGIYTRQSFFDYNVGQNAVFKQLKLWASRWVTTNDYTDIASPWYDGKYKFRDWDSRFVWQFSGDNNG